MRGMRLIAWAFSVFFALTATPVFAFYSSGMIPGYDKAEYSDLHLVANTLSGIIKNRTDGAMVFSAQIQFLKSNCVIGSAFVHENIPANGSAKFTSNVSTGDPELGSCDLRWVVSGADPAFSKVYAPSFSGNGQAGPTTTWRDLVLERNDYRWKMQGAICYSGATTPRLTLEAYVLDGQGRALATSRTTLLNVAPGSRPVEFSGNMPNGGFDGLFRYGLRVAE